MNFNAAITASRIPWLLDYLATRGGHAPRTDVLDAGARVGLSRGQVHRAARAAGVTTTRTATFPAETVWHAPTTTTERTPT